MNENRKLFPSFKNEQVNESHDKLLNIILPHWLVWIEDEETNNNENKKE